MNYLNEAFQKLNLLTEDDFDLSIDKDKVDELRSFVADDIDAIDEEPIIDVEAETDDDLKDNYIGKVIVECDCCHSRLYKDIDKVVIDDETGLANIEEECPVCGTASGYTVIGKIEEFNKDANFEPKEEEDEIEDDAAEKGADEEHDEEEIDDDDVTEALKEALGLNDLAKEEKEKLEKSAITEAEVCPECGDVIDDEHPMCDKCKENAAEKEEIEEACEDCLDEAYAQEIDWAADEDDLSTEEAVIASIKEAGLPEGIDVMVLDLEGPDTGWPLVRLTGPKDLVDGFLKDTGFEDLLDDEDFDEGMKNMAIDSKKDKDIEDALDNLSDEELARLSELSKAKDESLQKVELASEDSKKLDEEKDCDDCEDKKDCEDCKEEKCDEACKNESLTEAEDKMPVAYTILGHDKDGYPIDVSPWQYFKEYGVDGQTLYATPEEAIEVAKTIPEAEAVLKVHYDPGETGLVNVTIWDDPEEAEVVWSKEKNESLTEDVNNVEVKTENGDVEVSKDGDKVTVDFAPAGEEAPVEPTGEEMIAPLDAEEVAEIEANEPITDVEDDIGLDAAPEEAEVPAEDEFDLEDEEELEDEDLLGAEDFKEESFDYLGNAYLRKIYENVNSFNTTQVSIENGKLVVEGLIKFESGKEKKTTFVFENAQTSKRGKTILEGKNETFSNSNKAFRLKGVVDNGTFVCETLAYNYTAKQLNESNNEETVKVSGKVIAA